MKLNDWESFLPVSETRLRLSTKGYADVVDLTRSIEDFAASQDADAGTVSVFVTGSTAAITLMEFEPGGVSDLQNTLDRLIPVDEDYEHNRLNHDTNSHAHIRAALIGPSKTIPLSGRRLLRGTWQQIVLVDFDDRPRERTVVVQILS
jgi:secondary thiamine-phosphate synthase enzyme